MQAKGNFNYTVRKKKSRNFFNKMMKKKLKSNTVQKTLLA